MEKAIAQRIKWYAGDNRPLIS